MIGFNSPIFLFLFLPLFMASYCLATKAGRLLLGIMGSLVFYAAGSLGFLPVMVGLIIINFIVGRNLTTANGERKRPMVLWAGIFINIGTLVFFKIWPGAGLPLGLSYVSFQLVAYLVDAYNKPSTSEDNFLRFAFYVLLFPKIVVGPINRYGPLKEQIDRLEVTSEGLALGIRRFILGLAKKVLIADTLARVTNPVFALSKPVISPGLAWFVLVSFALQLYFDFSGYTDMAIGLGQMMGLKFIENFNFPYLSRSISDFWRRWHISLSSWFRDYVFFPLERRRLRWMGQAANVLIVFSLTGLWHGIAWNYLTWGALHGLAIVAENTALGRRLRTLWQPLQHLYALAVILIGWVFFRSPTLSYALRFILRLAGDSRSIPPLSFQEMNPLPIVDPTIVLAFVVGIAFSLPIGQWVANKIPLALRDRFLLGLPSQILRDGALLVLFVLSVAALVSTSIAPGLYGKF